MIFEKKETDSTTKPRLQMTDENEKTEKLGQNFNGKKSTRNLNRKIKFTYLNLRTYKYQKN